MAIRNQLLSQEALLIRNTFLILIETIIHFIVQNISQKPYFVRYYTNLKSFNGKIFSVTVVLIRAKNFYKSKRFRNLTQKQIRSPDDFNLKLTFIYFIFIPARSNPCMFEFYIRLQVSSSNIVNTYLVFTSFIHIGVAILWLLSTERSLINTTTTERISYSLDA